MYTPPAFKDDDLESIYATMRAARLAQLVTATATGLMASPLPLFLNEDEGDHGVLYGHLAKANPQWRSEPVGESLALFLGPEAYVTPSWYATKQETGKVVPTWNYAAVEAQGTVEFFQDPDRLLEAVTRLTKLYEEPRPRPWAVVDAPEDFLASQLKGIVGVRMVVTKVTGKQKMSQNRNEADREGVRAGLSASERAGDKVVANLIPKARRD